MLNVGLTGGIASGKSTVAQLLVEKGAFLVDADALVHELEAPEVGVWEAIVTHFGVEILKEDRTIDRRRLGAIVFTDARARETLNRLVHPAVQEERRRRIAAIAAVHPQAVILSDVPLLFETGMQGDFDLVLLVYVPLAVQHERLAARDGFSREEAKARLASQMPITSKVALSDFVIRNDGDFSETERQVEAVWLELVKQERGKGRIAS